MNAQRKLREFNDYLKSHALFVILSQKSDLSEFLFHSKIQVHSPKNKNQWKHPPLILRVCPKQTKNPSTHGVGDPRVPIPHPLRGARCSGQFSNQAAIQLEKFLPSYKFSHLFLWNHLSSIHPCHFCSCLPTSLATNQPTTAWFVSWKSRSLQSVSPSKVMVPTSLKDAPVMVDKINKGCLKIDG